MSGPEPATKRHKVEPDLVPSRRIGKGHKSSKWRARTPSKASTSTGFHTHPTAGTGSTKDFWVPSTGDEPYIRPRTAPEKKEAIMKEFEIPLDQNDDSSKGPKVTFWHYERDIRGSQSCSKRKSDPPSTSQFVKDYFCGHKSPADSMRAFLNGRDRGEFKASVDWDSWPRSHKELKEDEVAQAFVKFLNTIIEIQGLSDTRVAVDRQKIYIKTRDKSRNGLKPDVFVWAKQSGAYPPVKGKPPAISQKQVVKKRPRGVDPTPAEIPPAVDWPWCLIPIEIKTENGKNAASDHLQVGAYVREVFAAQPNRRFVPSLLITEVNFQFLLWDRAGVVISHPVDYYHREDNFDLFCSTLSAIVSWDPERVGFDTTLFYPEPTSGVFPDPPKMIIKAEIEEESFEGKVTNLTSYQIEDVYCRPYTLRGCGSTSWRVHKLGNPGDHYLILDSWVEGGSVWARKVNRQIKVAKVKGVVEVVAIYDMQLTTQQQHRNTDVNPRHPDDTRHIRISDEYTKDGLNLVHTRTVLRCDAKPLGEWSNTLELVASLHDAIEVHKRLYESKILHCGIFPWNIFIARPPPGVSDSLRGALIDFTCATLLGSGHVISVAERIPGSIWFMSHFMVTSYTSTGTYLDDLESFYWILFSFFCAALRSSENLTWKSVARQMSQYVANGNHLAASQVKHFHFYGGASKFGTIPQESLRPIGELLEKLRILCGKRLAKYSDGIEHAPEVDYKEVLDAFKSTISKIPLMPTSQQMGTAGAARVSTSQ